MSDCCGSIIPPPGPQGPTGATGPAGPVGATGPQGPGQFKFTAGPSGFAVVSVIGNPLYELMYANRTGSVMLVSDVTINGGRDGMAIDAANVTKIEAVRRNLDGSGVDALIAQFDNSATAIPAKADLGLLLSGTSINNGQGIFAVVMVLSGGGTNLSPGLVMYMDVRSP